MDFHDAQTAFDHAIKVDAFHMAPYHPKYAGRYMYMGTKLDAQGIEVDGFKHIVTRAYTWVPHSWFPSGLVG